MRDIQMLAHKTLQRPECLLVPWEMLYIHTGRVHYNLFRKRYIPEGPTDVVHQGFTLCQGKILLFPFSLKLITQIIFYQIFVVYTKFIYICISCNQICLLSPRLALMISHNEWLEISHYQKLSTYVMCILAKILLLFPNALKPFTILYQPLHCIEQLRNLSLLL